jgi:hypothetical protein
MHREITSFQEDQKYASIRQNAYLILYQRKNILYKEREFPRHILEFDSLGIQTVCYRLQANFPDREKCLCNVWGLDVSREIGHAVSVPHRGDYEPPGARYKTRSCTMPHSANLYLAATALGRHTPHAENLS